MTTIEIQNEEHWHELRKKHVGGSEVAALFDACSYMTHFELWLKKSGKISSEIEDNDRMMWGRLLEEGVAQGVAIKKGWKIMKPDFYLVSDDTQGMGCTPDRIIGARSNDNKSTGLLQIKVVDKFVFMKWEDGEPPLQYQLQLQHELGCGSYKWGALAVLVGGNELHVFEYDRHEAVIAKIKAAITSFWRSVDRGEEPKAVADDYDVVKDLYPLKAGKEIDLSKDNELPDLCSKALRYAEERKRYEKAEKECKAEIIRKIGDAESATCTGFSLKYPEIVKQMPPKEACVQKYRMLTIKESN
jgi:putative phage-type endonuclease